MRRIILLLTVVLLFSLPLMSETITGKGCNVRDKACLTVCESKVIDQIEAGEKVEIVEEFNHYLKVKVKDARPGAKVYIGYVWIERISEDQKTITHQGVNVRERPTIESKTLGIVLNGSEILEVYGGGMTWKKIKNSAGKILGWVNSQYIK